jgi:hypothetical protein
MERIGAAVAKGPDAKEVKDRNTTTGPNSATCRKPKHYPKRLAVKTCNGLLGLALT